MKKARLCITLLLALALATGMVAPAFATAATEDATSVPLVVGESNFSEKFSPFYYDSVYDGRIVEMTAGGSFMVIDRAGNTVYNGIEGETNAYNGVDYTYTGLADITEVYDEATDITTYTTKLREGVLFSDGVEMTADDLIFTYYVYLDPSYAGSTTLNAFPILGLSSYRSQLPDDLLAQYTEIFDAIYDAGADHEWAEGDLFTAEQQEYFWATLKEYWMQDVQKIIEYVNSGYGNAKTSADEFQTVAQLGKTPEEVAESEGLQVAFGMVMWGFGSLEEDGTFAAPSGKSWTLADDDFPTLDDYYAEMYEAYEGDPEAYIVESTDETDTLAQTRTAFMTEFGQDAAPEGGIPNISGIRKLDDYTVEVKLQGYSAPAIYSVCGLSVAPMHYYGDASLYDYENNMFGFPFGDTSIVQAKTREPMGYGPYKFVSYENKVVYLEANELYWRGEPSVKYLQYKETNNDEVIPGIQTGTIDLGEINGSKKDFGQVAEGNSNGEITGDVISSSLVDNRGYGYIGINADRVRVGEDSFSEESKNVRKAIGTMLAVYRDVAYDSYYGEAATVINYPISNVIWAAPKPTDEGYKVAFSVDAEGNDIYTSEMTSDEKYVVALETAKGFFLAAGYTFDEAAGVFTEAPEGASLSYEVTVIAGGTGDHPSFAVITDAANALAQLGITLKINDFTSANGAAMWDMLDAGTADLWCAAWQNNNPDPDMYQTYHSSNIYGRGGSDSNHYHVALPELDELIMLGRQSSDQAYRKEIYKQALDIVVDAAVEVPCYQRQNATIFSTERIDMDTMTPDITTWRFWYEEVEGVQMNAAQ